MSTTQKVIKYIAIAFAIFLIINIFSAIAFGIFTVGALIFGFETTSSEESFTFSESYISEGVGDVNNYTDITKLDLEVDISKVNIRYGNEIKVEANNVGKNFSSKNNNGTLIIKEEKLGNVFNDNIISEINIYIPKGFTFEYANIETGAGDTYIEGISAKKADLEFGMGKIVIDNLVSDKTDIKSGVGTVEINNADVTNLDLETGVGKFSFNGYIKGKSEIETGIGKTELSLLGTEQDYKITINKGIGTVSINGVNRDNSTYGSGENTIDVKSGIGVVEIKTNNNLI